MPERKQEHDRSHKQIRARVEHAFARMKTWKILRDCRLRGDGVHHAMLGIARLHNLNLAGQRLHQRPQEPYPHQPADHLRDNLGAQITESETLLSKGVFPFYSDSVTDEPAPEGRSPGPQAPRTSKPLDAQSLRALAHPLRLLLLNELRMRGPSTAARLAARLDESASNVSWHLRTLAAYGFIESTEELGNRRERWWRAVHRYTTVPNADFHGDSELEDALRVLTVESLNQYFDRANQFVTDDWSSAWQAASTVGHWMFRLTPEELLRMGEEVTAILERYEREARTGPFVKGEEQVVFQLQVFPWKRDEQQ